MREIQYKDFSWETHIKNWKLRRPNVCQFELTFKCDLHCKHCYTDCYNKERFIKEELDTSRVKFILDKVYEAGCIWLCFTGGDPLTRTDFLEIYDYAKRKGFIVTVFTNAYSITEEIASHFAKSPPFVIEMTLNAVSKDLYDDIAGVKGAFEKVMKGIDLLRKYSIPLKIKTQVTTENFGHLPAIKSFLASKNIVFRPSIFLHARLNGDSTPASLRVPVERLVSQEEVDKEADDGCRSRGRKKALLSDNIFKCAIGGGDGIYIDPYGNTFPCVCIREPKFSLLTSDISTAQAKILSWVKSRKFSKDSLCKSCSLRDNCYLCPGKALLEKGRLDAHIEWFCDLARQISLVGERR